MSYVRDQLRRKPRTSTELAESDRIRPPRNRAQVRWPVSFRWLGLVAAAAAVAAGVIVAVTVTAHPPGRPPVGQLPAGAPKYYVTLNSVAQGGARYGVQAVVRSSATGAPISSVQLLRSAGFPQPLAITGAASDRAFLITIPGALEVLRLAPDGHVLRLTRLPKTVWDLGTFGSASGSDVLSPNGSEVLLSIGWPGSCTSCQHGVAMFAVTTGVIRKWLLAKNGKNSFFTPVNWPGDGSQVLLSGGLGGGYRLLDIARPGNSLLASSRPITGPTVPRGWATQGGYLLLPDQQVLAGFVTARNLPPPASTVAVHATARLVATSAGTGRPSQVLYVLSRSSYTGGLACYPESLGPTQVHVLLWCLNGFGRLDGSHFTPLPGASKDLEVTLGAAW